MILSAVPLCAAEHHFVSVSTQSQGVLQAVGGEQWRLPLKNVARDQLRAKARQAARHDVTGGPAYC
jgi:hypothetical protein